MLLLTAGALPPLRTSVALRSIGRRIAELRKKEKRWTQDELAAALGHQTYKYVQSIEGGKQNLEIETLVKIANALGVELVELFKPPKDPSPARPGRPRNPP